MAVGSFATCVVKETAKQVKKMIDGWNHFLHTEVVVGITEETNSSRGSVTNSELLYLHENGIPSHNIPPRPVLVPAINQDEAKQKINQMLRQAAYYDLVFGDQQRAEQSFHKAGMVGRDACKNYIKAGTNLAPNAEATIKRKGSSKPLIDTSSMMNSITYAVRKK